MGTETPPWLIGIFVAAIAGLAAEQFRRSAADRKLIETTLTQITAAIVAATRSIDANTASNGTITEQMRDLRFELRSLQDRRGGGGPP